VLCPRSDAEMTHSAPIVRHRCSVRTRQRPRSQLALPGNMGAPQPSHAGQASAIQADPRLLTMQREGTAPEVFALSVQSQVCPPGTVLDSRPFAPTDFPMASCTDNTRLKVPGPATDPVAVVVPPDTTQVPGVGFAPRRSKLTMRGREVVDEHADSRLPHPSSRRAEAILM